MTSEFDLSQAVEDSDESTVDLTHEWEDDSTVDLTQDEIHVRGLEETIDLLNLKDEDEDEGIELLFVTEIECVGLQYYNGVAHAGEDIYLIREPYNRHDRNAIRVDNCHHEIVGHIRSTVAKYLSLILDDMNLRSSVEYGIEKMDASIPRSAGIYTMPIELEMYGRYSDKVNKIHILLQRSGVVMKQARYSYKPMTQQIESRMASILKQEEVRPIPRITFPFPLDEEVRPRPRMAATLPLDEVPMVTTTDWKSQSELDDIFDKNQQSLSTLPCIQPPEQLITNLLKHQLVGLSWMYQRENTDQINPLFVKVTEKGKTVWLSTITHSSQPREPTAVRGGLLCDEMGLGKTLMTIALILKSPPQGLTYPPGRDIQDDRLGRSSSQNRPRGGVLKTIPRNSITTLIVCPLSVMSNWMDQIDQHVKPGVLKVRTYQGPNRGKLVDEIINNKIDILLASYHTLAIDFKSNFGDEDAPTQKKQKVDSIFSVRFHRVVLDECHMIRNNKTSMFKACVKIDAQFKFGLTGTPIQNKPEDVYSLFRFLNVEPVCCEKNFRSSIAQPIRNGDPKGLTLLRTILCHVALRRTKEKEGIRLPEKTVEVCSIKFREDSIDYKIYSILFKSARVAFAAILTGGEEYVLNQYMSILETILRLRQTCCSLALLPRQRLVAAKAVCEEIQRRDREGNKPLTAAEGRALLAKLKGVLEQSDGFAECAICLQGFAQEKATILRTCQHSFCESCITQILSVSQSCPLCRAGFNQDDIVKMSDATLAASASSTDIDTETVEDSGLDWSQFSNAKSADSPKVSLLLQQIKRMGPDEKGVIFSQFTSFLDLIERSLLKAKYTITRIDGTMSVAERIQAMKDFNSSADGSPRLILCSLMAAGTGINLTRGNWCFITDLWWNGAVEDQAMDRVHRIGQSRAVTVVKLIIEASIEERILKLQEAKALLMKGSLEKLSTEEMRKARLEALMNLFDIS